MSSAMGSDGVRPSHNRVRCKGVVTLANLQGSIRPQSFSVVPKMIGKAWHVKGTRHQQGMHQRLQRCLGIGAI